jgi:hypothetical protein
MGQVDELEGDGFYTCSIVKGSKPNVLSVFPLRSLSNTVKSSPMRLFLRFLNSCQPSSGTPK